jgi:prepilin-type N-terminal cleavage/methylation domain-containing protein
MRLRDDGFSLVEVLVATALFVTVAASLLELFSLALGANLAARYRTEATILAAAKVEELLAIPWGSEAAASDETGGFTRTWTVSALPGRPRSALTIDVRVTHARVEPVRVLAVKVRQVR